MNLIEELRNRAKEIGPDWSDHAMLLKAADKIESLESGEYICKKCGLRKDSDHDNKADF